MNQLDLHGQVIVISGGKGGIGKAVAQRAEASGATVVVWDFANSSASDDGHYIKTDITDEAAVMSAAGQTADLFGKMDVLINCAGITGPTAAVAEYAMEDWRRVLDINLAGTFLCCKHVVPYMKAQGYGRIVNLASIAGKEGNAFQSAYSAAKAGVIALTKSLGKELCRDNICVNAVAPAMIETPLLQQMTEEMRTRTLAKIPMGRAGTAEEIAALVLWLATPECSFSSGAVFDASGGRATY